MKTKLRQPKTAQSLPTIKRARVSSNTCEVAPFTVPVEWVEVTFQIVSSCADYLNSQVETVRSRYGEEIYSYAIHASQIDDYQKSGKGSAEYTRAQIYKHYGSGPEAIHGKCQGQKVVPFTVRMLKWRWDKTVLFACEYLGCSPAAFARAALAERANGIREFYKNQAK